MRRSALKLYAPFIALALAQAAFVVASPSKGEKSAASTYAGAAPGAASSGTVGSGTGTGSGTGATGTGSSSAAVPGAAGSSAAGGTGVASGGGAAGGAGAAAAGDTSHCKNGQQTDIIYGAPPCAPKFVGNNGGSTYPGVTATEIKFFMMQCQSNEQVDAILASQGLAASNAETDATIAATVKFMNAHYEFYGRKIVAERQRMDCTTSPHDAAKNRQAGAEVAKKHPFMVYAAGPLVEGADVLAQNGIVSIGIPWAGREFYAGRRPYRYDAFPNATESADWMTEYYCKKLAHGTATNAGVLIHPTIGGRNTPRKLGIVVPDDGTGQYLPGAKTVAAGVKACAGYSPPIFTYQQDIARGAEQTRVTVSALIDAKVTTILCICDAIAPAVFTKGLTSNNYYPEHFMAGSSLMDQDQVGRLYDPAQWTHAFGLSQSPQPLPFDQQDASKVWRASGNAGAPCNACPLTAGYLLLAGLMIQMAGPNLNPLTIEHALIGNQYHRGGWAETGGNPTVTLFKFGPGDYNLWSDFREVYWDQTATSPIDGKQGAYVQMNKGRRYAAGELDSSFTIAPKPN
jgi:hypothetical protein